MKFYVLRLVNFSAERSEADKPAKVHKTICILFFFQTFITNYLRHVKKSSRNFK
jgi:hypothetical protein